MFSAARNFSGPYFSPTLILFSAALMLATHRFGLAWDSLIGGVLEWVGEVLRWD